MFLTPLREHRNRPDEIGVVCTYKYQQGITNAVQPMHIQKVRCVEPEMILDKAPPTISMVFNPEAIYYKPIYDGHYK